MCQLILSLIVEISYLLTTRSKTRFVHADHLIKDRDKEQMRLVRLNYFFLSHVSNPLQFKIVIQFRMTHASQKLVLQM